MGFKVNPIITDLPLEGHYRAAQDVAKRAGRLARKIGFDPLSHRFLDVIEGPAYEAAYNVKKHGMGGLALMHSVERPVAGGTEPGVEVMVFDLGPGISDLVNLAGKPTGAYHRGLGPIIRDPSQLLCDSQLKRWIKESKGAPIKLAPAHSPVEKGASFRLVWWLSDLNNSLQV